MSPGDAVAPPARTRPFPLSLGLAVALISAAALSYEVLLTRLFTIIQWHHFAYMIISLALLGFGASGTFLSYTQDRYVQKNYLKIILDRLLRRFPAAFALNAAVFGVGSLGAFALAERVPFNPLELFWDLHQPLHLLAVYALLSIPVFCAANCIGGARAPRPGPW
jgi:hypothetical protein